MDITIPVSAGHLIDQITILEIKKARIADRTKRDNVCRELDALTRIRQNLPELATPALADLERQLFEANERLWRSKTFCVLSKPNRISANGSSLRRAASI